MSQRLRLLVLLALFVVFPSTTFAEDPDDQGKEGGDQHWGISIWGLSYHVDRTIDYDENNWGLGIRYYNRPQWRWLGRAEDSRLFLEVDALRNSHGGLVLPLSVGLDYQVMSFSDCCKVLAVAAFTVAYYQNRREDASELKFGPGPALTLTLGHVRTNMVIVLRPQKAPLAAIVGSLTIVF
jgi:hypothetical protein